MNHPVFAVIGHPNEGKSSVVATLTENDRVTISDTPGETTRCERFRIELRGESVLEIVDTPGFQNPSRTLAWFEAYTGPEDALLDTFLNEHRQDPAFHHDVELLSPLRDRAGILYVADASRPLRESDRQEMEILRLIGSPRMALLNTKRDASHYVEEWQSALNRRFNLVRPFNAHHASFTERLALMEALALLTPEQEPALRNIQRELEADWTRRAKESVLILEDLLQRVLRHQTRLSRPSGASDSEWAQQAGERYQADLTRLEQQARKRWRKVYRHTRLPESGDAPDISDEDLFARRVWTLLGLSRRQLAMLGAMTGGAVGLGADAAAGGITFGLLGAAGTTLGAIGGWMGGPKLGRKRLPIPGKRQLSSEHMEVGPLKNTQLLFILVDRSLLYLTRLMNWTHARRDHEAFRELTRSEDSLVRNWSDSDRKKFLRWIRLLQKNSIPEQSLSKKIRKMLLYALVPEESNEE